MAKSDVNVHVDYAPLLASTMALIGIAILFLGYAYLSKTPQHLTLVSVTASGTLNASPSQAQISIYLNATGPTSSAAVSNLSGEAQTLNSTLMPFLGYSGGLIKTMSYNVYLPSPCEYYNTSYYYYPAYCIPAGSPDFYVATEYITVTVPDVRNVDPILSQISAITGASVTDVSSQLSDSQRTTLSQQALALAMSNATAQASIVAGSGAVLALQNVTIESSYLYYPSYGTLSSASATGNKTFFPGTASVSKSVYVVYSVK